MSEAREKYEKLLDEIRKKKKPLTNEEQDELLEKMDALWWKMNKEEREEVDTIEYEEFECQDE